MRRMRLCRALALVIWLPVATTGAALRSATPASATASGAEAPDHVVAEIQQALDDAVRRFDAMDSAGVLAHVSDRYRTSPLTKPLLAEQLRAIFALHDQVRAHVRIDEVRLVGEHAWIYSTSTPCSRLSGKRQSSRPARRAADEVQVNPRPDDPASSPPRSSRGRCTVSGGPSSERALLPTQEFDDGGHGVAEAVGHDVVRDTESFPPSFHRLTNLADGADKDTRHVVNLCWGDGVPVTGADERLGSLPSVIGDHDRHGHAELDLREPFARTFPDPGELLRDCRRLRRPCHTRSSETPRPGRARSGHRRAGRASTLPWPGLRDGGSHCR